MLPTQLISGLLLLWSIHVEAACECGYRIPATGKTFTHRIHNNFEGEPDTQEPELSSWDIQTWNSTVGDEKGEVVRQNEASNVWIEDGQLHLRQKGWSGEGPVSSAELHSKHHDIFHGHFAMRYRIRQKGENQGGAVSGFFFYQSDVQESDIEILTNDNNTRAIHYTNHPSNLAYHKVNGTTIPGATFKETLRRPWTDFQEQRFEWTADYTKYYQEGGFVPARTITKNVPNQPGKIMINLWSNNGTWSGPPSTEDVVVDIQYITMFFNTSSSNTGEDEEFNTACSEAEKNAVCGPRENIGKEEILVQVDGAAGLVPWYRLPLVMLFVVIAGALL